MNLIAMLHIPLEMLNFRRAYEPIFMPKAQHDLIILGACRFKSQYAVSFQSALQYTQYPIQGIPIQGINPEALLSKLLHKGCIQYKESLHKA